jgi:hypothetical protein
VDDHPDDQGREHHRAVVTLAVALTLRRRVASKRGPYRGYCAANWATGPIAQSQR